MAIPSFTISISAAMSVLLLMTSALVFPTSEGDTAGHAEQGVPSVAADLDFWVPVGPADHHFSAAARAVAAGAPLMAPPFRVCRQCRCCEARNPARCAMVPCCYGIDCNLPGKPVGQCTFAPKACSCNNCS